MKWVIVAASVVTGLCGATGAKAGCSSGESGAVLHVSDWDIQPVDSRNNRITLTLKNETGKPIRMADGQINFADALGGQIASMDVDRDTKVDDGGEYKQTGVWGPYTFERLLYLKKEEVAVEACVKSVLYDDGTKQGF